MLTEYLDENGLAQFFSIILLMVFTKMQDIENKFQKSGVHSEDTCFYLKHKKIQLFFKKSQPKKQGVVLSANKKQNFVVEISGR